MKNVVTILILFLFNLAASAENKVPYTPEMDDYIGTWECVANNPDGQWTPKKIVIKKTGKNVKFDCYKNSGKVAVDFYDGPYQYSDGHFTWCTSGKYGDIRNSSVFKYDFRTSFYDGILILLVTKYFYNEFGNIDSDSYSIEYQKTK